MGNQQLNMAQKEDNDEFYTQPETIEAELTHYKEELRGKTVYCNCDHPLRSHFFRFFVEHFADYGLKAVLATGYQSQQADLFSMGAPKPALSAYYAGGGGCILA